MGLGRRTPDRLCVCVIDIGPDCIVDDCALIPHIELTHRRERAHPIAVSVCAGSHDALARFGTKAVVLCDDRDACHKPFDIPLPRARQCLVEVVDVEDKVSLGRCVQAEVRDMSVAAQLRGKPGIRGGRQVGGHQQRRAAKECKSAMAAFGRIAPAASPRSATRPATPAGRTGFGRSCAATKSASADLGSTDRRPLPRSCRSCTDAVNQIPSARSCGAALRPPLSDYVVPDQALSAAALARAYMASSTAYSASSIASRAKSIAS